MMRIDKFKRRTSFGYIKWLWVINDIMLFKTVMPVRNYRIELF